MSDAEISRFEEALCFNFYLGWRLVQAYYGEFLPPGMSPQRIYALGVCDPVKGTTVSEIARALQIDPPAVSALLDRMDDAGLIVRRRVSGRPPPGPSLPDPGGRAIAR